MQSAIINVNIPSQRFKTKFSSSRERLRKEALRFADEQWDPNFIKNQDLRRIMKKEYIRRFRLELQAKMKKRNVKRMIQNYLKRHKQTSITALTYTQLKALLKKINTIQKTKKRKNRRKNNKKGRKTKRNRR